MINKVLINFASMHEYYFRKLVAVSFFNSKLLDLQIFKKKFDLLVKHQGNIKYNYALYFHNILFNNLLDKNSTKPWSVLCDDVIIKDLLTRTININSYLLKYDIEFKKYVQKNSEHGNNVLLYSNNPYRSGNKSLNNKNIGRAFNNNSNNNNSNQSSNNFVRKLRTELENKFKAKNLELYDFHGFCLFDIKFNNCRLGSKCKFKTGHGVCPYCAKKNPSNANHKLSDCVVFNALNNK